MLSRPRAVSSTAYHIHSPRRSFLPFLFPTFSRSLHAVVLAAPCPTAQVRHLAHELRDRSKFEALRLNEFLKRNEAHWREKVGPDPYTCVVQRWCLCLAGDVELGKGKGERGREACRTYLSVGWPPCGQFAEYTAHHKDTAQTELSREVEAIKAQLAKDNKQWRHDELVRVHVRSTSPCFALCPCGVV